MKTRIAAICLGVAALGVATAASAHPYARVGTLDLNKVPGWIQETSAIAAFKDAKEKELAALGADVKRLEDAGDKASAARRSQWNAAGSGDIAELQRMIAEREAHLSAAVKRVADEDRVDVVVPAIYARDQLDITAEVAKVYGSPVVAERKPVSSGTLVVGGASVVIAALLLMFGMRIERRRGRRTASVYRMPVADERRAATDAR